MKKTSNIELYACNDYPSNFAVVFGKLYAGRVWYNDDKKKWINGKYHIKNEYRSLTAAILSAISEVKDKTLEPISKYENISMSGSVVG